MADRLTGLEDLVREHRFTIAVVFPAVGAVTLVASEQGLLPAPLAYSPLLLLVGVAVMRSPLVVGLLPVLDRRALGALGVLAAYTYAIEYVGVRTGWPYGTFSYEVTLGPMVGGIPAALPLLFVPLVLNAYLLTILLTGSHRDRVAVRVPAAIATVVAVDLVLDPAAVAVGFWSFEAGGWYHGVPVSNYLGWILSGTVAVLLVDVGFDRSALLERLEDCEFVLDDLVSFVLLWGAINALYVNPIPVAVAACFGLALWLTDHYDRETVAAIAPRVPVVPR